MLISGFRPLFHTCPSGNSRLSVLIWLLGLRFSSPEAICGGGKAGEEEGEEEVVVDFFFWGGGDLRALSAAISPPEFRHTYDCPRMAAPQTTGKPAAATWVTESEKRLLGKMCSYFSLPAPSRVATELRTRSAAALRTQAQVVRIPFGLRVWIFPT